MEAAMSKLCKFSPLVVWLIYKKIFFRYKTKTASRHELLDCKTITTHCTGKGIACPIPRSLLHLHMHLEQNHGNDRFKVSVDHKVKMVIRDPFYPGGSVYANGANQELGPFVVFYGEVPTGLKGADKVMQLETNVDPDLIFSTIFQVLPMLFMKRIFETPLHRALNQYSWVFYWKTAIPEDAAEYLKVRWIFWHYVILKWK